MEEVNIVQNDTKAVLDFTIIQDGKVVDLTGCTVKFYMVNSATGVLKVDGGTCNIIDASLGKCQYTWAAGDTDTAGDYWGEVEVTFPDDSIQTGYEKLIIHIREEAS